MPPGLGASRAAAAGLGIVGLIAAGIAFAPMFGLHPLAAQVGAGSEWIAPVTVIGAVPSAAAPAPSASASPAPAAPTGPPTGPPTAVKVPSVGISTTLEQLGLAADGTLSTPAFTDAGWYKLGTAPGDIGPAIIVGHVDSTTGPAVFYRLPLVKVGAQVQVQRDGQWLTFTVTAINRYAKANFPTDLVYGPTPTPELRLITCGGAFDATKGSYEDDIVVFARETA
jgi:hypothetical protein